jgi:hypothetical protein
MKNYNDLNVIVESHSDKFLSEINNEILSKENHKFSIWKQIFDISKKESGGVKIYKYGILESEYPTELIYIFKSEGIVFHYNPKSKSIPFFAYL